jgi:hypothetical protein
MSKAALYYIILALVVFGKAGHTLYQRSLVVHHGFSVSEYQQEQRQLNQKKSAIMAQLADQRSLASIKSSDLVAEFSPIKQVIVIAPSANVASLQ